LLPTVHTGPVRQDDRRIISGILHRLREGCRWRALRTNTETRAGSEKAES
jgi:transposase